MGFVLDNIHIHSCTIDSTQFRQDNGLSLKKTQNIKIIYYPWDIIDLRSIKLSKRH